MQSLSKNRFFSLAPRFTAGTLAVASTIAVACVPSIAFGQCDEPDVLPAPYMPLNGVINAYTNWGGRLIVGGDFNHPTEQYGRLLAWNGIAVSPIGSTNGFVTALSPSSGGPALPTLVVGGSFTAAGGVAATNIARRTMVEPGTWSAMGQGLNNNIRCITYLPSGPTSSTVYAGGIFTASGPTAVNRIARFDGANWQPMGSGLQSSSAFCWADEMIAFGGQLVVGGIFDTAGGLTANSIARWSGTAWSTLGTGVHIGATRGRVSALTTFNGELIVGGEFDTAGSTPAANIARWNGTTWLAMGAVGVPNGQITGLAVVDGVLYASAGFTFASGDLASRILRWNGSSFEIVVTEFEGFVYEMFPYQNRLHVGGSFNYPGTSSYTAGVQSPYWIQVGCECPGDVNSSGAVDVDDLLAVISAWAHAPLPPAQCPADINNNGIVNVDDLLAVISAWGACE